MVSSTDGQTDRQTDGRTDGRGESSIPPHKFCGGYKKPRNLEVYCPNYDFAHLLYIGHIVAKFEEPTHCSY